MRCIYNHLLKGFFKKIFIRVEIKVQKNAHSIFLVKKQWQNLCVHMHVCVCMVSYTYYTFYVLCEREIFSFHVYRYVLLTYIFLEKMRYMGLAVFGIGMRKWANVGWEKKRKIEVYPCRKWKKVRLKYKISKIYTLFMNLLNI